MIAMSLIAIMGFSIVMLFLRPMPMTDAAGTLAVALVTAVTTNVGVIVGFFFGSSKTSREKDEMATAQAATIATLSAAPANNGGNGKVVVVEKPVIAAPTEKMVQIEGEYTIHTMSDGTFIVKKAGAVISTVATLEDAITLTK